MARLDPSVSLRPSAPGVVGEARMRMPASVPVHGRGGAGRRRAGRDVARGSCRVAARPTPGGDVPPDGLADGTSQPGYDAFPRPNC